MAVDSLLVAFDASDGASKALGLAADIAALNPAAHIDVTTVIPIPLLNDQQKESFKDILDMMMSDGEDLLAQAMEQLGELSARADTLILTGQSPATEIIKLIDRRDYDLVIIGNRGLSGLKEYMGSVSHKVLQGSHVPVLIAK